MVSRKSLFITTLIFIILIIGIKPSKTTSTSSDATTFISFGDFPHVPEHDVENNLKMLLSSMNKYDPALFIHVGDTFGRVEPCTNSMIDLQRKMLNSLDAPVFYTPGDNEWRDCYQKNGENYDNQERLEYIRKTYYSDNKTLGKNALYVENYRSNGYPENARIMIENVAFISAHVIGSGNNFDPRSERNTKEYFTRDSANINWIKESFKKYDKASAFVVVIHADMYDRGTDNGRSIPKVPILAPQYEKFGMTLYNISNEYKKPILILHGDTHTFKDFQPNSINYPFIYAIENYGNPDLKALMIEVDVSKNKPFNVVQIIHGESLKTWLFRNFQRVINYITRNFKKIMSYFK